MSLGDLLSVEIHDFFYPSFGVDVVKNQSNHAIFEGVSWVWTGFHINAINTIVMRQVEVQSPRITLLHLWVDCAVHRLEICVVCWFA